jgi:hypothetical protein
MDRFLLKIIVTCLLACLASAGMTAGMNYQSKLTDAEGEPLSGSHTLYFKVYRGGTETGGGVQVFADSAVVEAVGGVVNCAVGASDPLSLSAAVGDVASETLLEVAIDIPSNIVIPRARISRAATAIAAEHSRTNVAYFNSASGLPIEAGKFISLTRDGTVVGFGNCNGHLWLSHSGRTTDAFCSKPGRGNGCGHSQFRYICSCVL